MAKIRVYELAKELEMESKDVIRRLGKMGFEAKNHMNTVDDEYADMLRDIMRPRLIMAEKKKATEEKAKRAETVKDEALPTFIDKTEKKDKPKEAHHVAAVAGEKQEHQEHKPSFIRKEEAPKTEKPQREGIDSTGQSISGRAALAAAQQAQSKNPNQPRKQGVFAQPRNNNRNRNGNNNNRNNRNDNRSGDRVQGNFRNRDGNQGGNFRNRDGQNNRGENRSQGGRFSNKDNRQQGNFRNGDNRQSGNRNDNRQGGNFQRRDNNRPGKRDGNLVTPPPPPEVVRPQEKKDSRRFDQKKKNSPYDKKNRNAENSRFESGYYRPNNKGKKGKKSNKPKEEMPAVTPKTVVIGESVIVSELAKSMSKTAAEVIKKLMMLGVMVTMNQEIDAETATIIGEEFGITVEVKVDKTLELAMEDTPDPEESLVSRPPVVTVMGHVDHGKTSLLDAIRKTNVISTEAGGITQHIGAYQVEINNKKITFLDTPGHEAFTAMRARGAQMTDIAILVVAADDGVMPQTIEAINHAKAAGVPIIVAINKIDKPGASPDKIRQELAEYELLDEDWGGDTIMCPVSAKKNEGINNLLEMVLLVAEMRELKANPNRLSRGTIIESQLDKNRGAVATVLVQKGTLKIGDILVCGSEYAKVRAMTDYKGRRIKEALPSTPAEILGFSNAPAPGDTFISVEDEKVARHIADHNSLQEREKNLNKSSMVSLEDLFSQIEAGEVKDLNIVVKADVQGSIEALCSSITGLSTNEIRVNIIHKGVGAINESDVMLAAASNALIIGFNVRPNSKTKEAAEREGVDMHMYRVIYEALDDIKAAMSGMLDPEYKEVSLGTVEVRQVIKVPKVGFVIGGYVTEGKVTRSAKVRVVRNGVVVHEGDIASLRRFKDDVREVAQGYECGISVENFNDIKVDDVLEVYVMEETKRTI